MSASNIIEELEGERSGQEGRERMKSVVSVSCTVVRYTIIALLARFVGMSYYAVQSVLANAK